MLNVLTTFDRRCLLRDRERGFPGKEEFMQKPQSRHPIAFLLYCAALCVAAAACSSVTAQDIEANTDVSGQPGFTKSLRYAPGPDGKTEIHWEPAYEVSNKGNDRFLLQDLTLDFTSGIDGQTGKTIDLVKARPMGAVKLYRSVDEVRNDRPSAEQNAPLRIEPGETFYVLVDEALILTADGVPIKLPKTGKTVDYLGPFLRLPKLEDGRYRCVVNAQLNLTVTTNYGSFTRSVEQALLPGGCVLILPRP
jgi:hypothetical protein